MPADVSVPSDSFDFGQDYDLPVDAVVEPEVDEDAFDTEPVYETVEDLNAKLREFHLVLGALQRESNRPPEKKVVNVCHKKPPISRGHLADRRVNGNFEKSPGSSGWAETEGKIKNRKREKGSRKLLRPWQKRSKSADRGGQENEFTKRRGLFGFSSGHSGRSNCGKSTSENNLDSQNGKTDSCETSKNARRIALSTLWRTNSDGSKCINYQKPWCLTLFTSLAKK